MKTRIYFIILLTIFLSKPTVTLGAVWATANFNAGNTISSVDGFMGRAGNGWADAWKKIDWTRWAPGVSGGAVTSSTPGYDPLYSGGGNYLTYHVEGEGGRMGVGRNCSDVAAYPHLPYTIEFSYRLDDGFESFNDDEDRIQFMGATYYRSTSANNCSYVIGAYGDNYGTADDGVYWMLYDAKQDGILDFTQLVNSGMKLFEGDTYDFKIEVNPINKTYQTTIINRDTSESYQTPTSFGWRADIADTDDRYAADKFEGRFMTSMRTSAAGDFLDSSIDRVTIYETDPSQQPVMDGFKGIWYAIERDLEGPEIGRYYYSGGMGTYPQQIRSIAQYSEEANKTFFVYGGTDEWNSTVYNCISYFDHATGQVARPRVIADTAMLLPNAHTNPCMTLDDNGYIYIFTNGKSNHQPCSISRSTQPYSIDKFERVLELPGSQNFSYAQPHFVDGKIFLLHTHYVPEGRALCFNTSSDGVTWDYNWETRPEIAMIPAGEYQISQHSDQTGKICSVFTYQPDELATKTNLYYMQTTDFGETWTTADGTLLTAPVTTVNNDALIHDYESEDFRVYLKDIQFDAEDQPVIMFLTTAGYSDPGPEADPRMLHIAHFHDNAWEIKDMFTVDHNYDYGQFTIEEDGTWRLIAPTIGSPQVYAAGGEMATWISDDEGDSWRMIRELTYDSEYNHTYAKQPVNADDDFYAFWADGDAYGPSESRFYFTDKNGTGVWQLPHDMDTDFATPELAYTPIITSMPGDANEDGKVDGSDVSILADNWQYGVGMTEPDATWWMGDFNGDGKVDGSDVTILADNWQFGVTATAAAVPEPSTLIGLLTLLLAGFALAARRR